MSVESQLEQIERGIAKLLAASDDSKELGEIHRDLSHLREEVEEIEVMVESLEALVKTLVEEVGLPPVFTAPVAASFTAS